MKNTFFTNKKLIDNFQLPSFTYDAWGHHTKFGAEKSRLIPLSGSKPCQDIQCNFV